MANPFVHVELATSDVAKAKAFYGQLFSWKFEDVPMDGETYTMIKIGDSTGAGTSTGTTGTAATGGGAAPSGTGGGMMKQPMPGAPSAWLAYVLVDDVNAATQKAKSLGASVVKGVTEAMGHGHFSIIVDPTGAPIALWQPLRKS